MRAVDVIARKRDGHPLSADEIDWFIRGCVDGTVPDYQAAAWLMAVYLRGMTSAETEALTRAMAASGRTLDLGPLAKRAVDKHSTGGVGDKVSLVAGPLAAAAGVVVPKMSGRGLGITGGTLDKLEAIPGLRVSLSDEEIRRQAAAIGLVIAGQTADLAPADALLYALRDVTATVGSLPLIVSSILSKKLAGGAPAIVLDVKGGRGAFMPTLGDAEVLARSLVEIGQRCERRVVAWVTRMDQPLGKAVGNAVEVREAIDVLAGGGPEDVRAVALTLAAEMIHLAGLAATDAEAWGAALRALESGEGLAKLRQMVAAQGGDPRVVDDPARLPAAPIVEEVRALVGGFIAGLDAAAVGSTINRLGAGREKKGEPIDHRIGVVFDRKLGDQVRPGDRLFTLHLTRPETLAAVRDQLLQAYSWSAEPVEVPSVVVTRLAGS